MRRGGPRRIALAVLALAVCGAALGAGAGEDDTRAGHAAFTDVYRVLMSPRCRNCHPAGDSPLQGDAGLPHAQNVSRRSAANGLPCTACHREQNGAEPESPPGTAHWQMPPAHRPMVFEGRSARALCEQLKDPEATGQRDLAALLTHVRTDHLVLWAWHPGPGRSPPPISHARFVAQTRRWIDAGAPCPAPE